MADTPLSFPPERTLAYPTTLTTPYLLNRVGCVPRLGMQTLTLYPRHPGCLSGPSDNFGPGWSRLISRRLQGVICGYIQRLVSFCLLSPASISLTMFRDEISPWVLGVAGSIYRKVKSWEEAKELYNARLDSDVIQILR